ncbi:hypothetical protein SAMN05660845_1748 [Flavobacterium swingsii]|jgi:hypothetical protein|uniref:ABC-2 type transport system permease protein n=1 Tax=Flavobacterium swingsii TaxID=498292 RepID=A0A1I0YJ88_9FLAO|nr:hypothetical protein [Flavobacterium swingsii]SFB12388.1 hypothetical protein SAMN05660845_1748 [Flavobacterium swingsii]
MLKILKYLITIRFRKLFAKDDNLAIALFVLAIAVSMYLFQVKLHQFINYAMLFLLQILSLQINRKDIELLSLNTNFRLILFFEYTILSLPILILLILNFKWICFLGFLISIFALTFINKSTAKAFRYPFKMFDPFWTISFRKYKLFLVIPVLGFLAYMGFKNQNPNLYYAALLVVGVILCVSSSEREKLHFVKASSFIGKDYLRQQIKTIAYNSAFVLIPISIVFLILKQFQILFFIPLLLFFPIINLLFKYTFFERKIVHNIFFALFVGNMIYGFPLLFIPLLYIKSVKNLKIIQNA